jgi:hypothetical protein
VQLLSHPFIARYCRVRTVSTSVKHDKVQIVAQDGAGNGIKCVRARVLVCMLLMCADAVAMRAHPHPLTRSRRSATASASSRRGRRRNALSARYVVCVCACAGREEGCVFGASDLNVW